MVRKIWKMVYGSTPAEFESSFSLPESVRRLSEATANTDFSMPKKQMAMGQVSESRVCLYRVIPMINIGFKTVFVGRFVNEGNRVILKGRFTMGGFFKLLASFWFAFCLFLMVTMAGQGTKSIIEAAESLLPGLVMLLLGAIFFQGGAWFTRKDPVWLSDVIRGALSGEPTNDASRDE